jgi:hypothetical protein
MTRPSNHSALLTEPTIDKKKQKKQTKKPTKTKKTKTITLSMNETTLKT